MTSFDVIYALDDAAEAAALGGMFRVLRPGGYLVLNVAAMDLLKGNHSVLSPRGAPLQPRHADASG